MISSRPPILIKVTFLNHFALEVWVSIFSVYLKTIDYLKLEIVNIFWGYFDVFRLECQKLKILDNLNLKSTLLQRCA